MISLLKRIIKSGWNSFFRDGSVVTTNVFLMVLTVLTVSSLFILRDASDYLLSKIEEKVDVSVYFELDSTESEIFEIKEDILEMPEVKEVNYISKEEAYQIFTERNKNNEVVMSSLDEVGINPFPASLNIRAFEASQYEAIVAFLERSSFEGVINKVDYFERRPVIERVFFLTSSVNRAGILFSVILGLIASMVVFNAVRIAIYANREEIKIQRLVGASNWFVRGPFLVQGMLIGILSAFIALILLGLFSWIFNSLVISLFYGVSCLGFFFSNFWSILLIQLLTGFSLGAISSLVAVRRYLKV